MIQHFLDSSLPLHQVKIFGNNLTLADDLETEIIVRGMEIGFAFISPHLLESLANSLGISIASYEKCIPGSVLERIILHCLTREKNYRIQPLPLEDSKQSSLEVEKNQQGSPLSKLLNFICSFLFPSFFNVKREVNLSSEESILNPMVVEKRCLPYSRPLQMSWLFSCFFNCKT
jgi:hypothetical protein